MPEVAVGAAGTCCPWVPCAHRCSLALLVGKDRAQVLQPGQREELLGRRSVWDTAQLKRDKVGAGSSHEAEARGGRAPRGVPARQRASLLGHVSTSIQATFILHVLSLGVAKSIRLCLLLLLLFPAFTDLLFLQLSLLLLSLPCTLRSIFLTPCNLSACLQPCSGFPPSLYPCTCSLPPAVRAGGGSTCTRGAGLLACCCVSGEMCSLHSELDEHLSVGRVPRPTPVF